MEGQITVRVKEAPARDSLEDVQSRTLLNQFLIYRGCIAEDSPDMQSVSMAQYPLRDLATRHCDNSGKLLSTRLRVQNVGTEYLKC